MLRRVPILLLSLTAMVAILSCSKGPSLESLTPQGDWQRGAGFFEYWYTTPTMVPPEIHRIPFESATAIDQNGEVILTLPPVFKDTLALRFREVIREYEDRDLDADPQIIYSFSGPREATYVISNGKALHFIIEEPNEHESPLEYKIDNEDRVEKLKVELIISGDEFRDDSSAGIGIEGRITAEFVRR